MQNSLPDLEHEDIRYNLHVGAEPIIDYNITLLWPQWRPPVDIKEINKLLQPPEVVRKNLSKIGIHF